MLRAALLTLPLALLTACAPSTPPPASQAVDSQTSVSPAESTGLTVDASQLGANHWLLTSATDAGNQPIDVLFPNEDVPLQLDFAEGRIHISGGCNQHNGSYRLEQQTLVIGPLAATERACEPALMAADQAIAAQFSKPLQVKAIDSGQLLLVSADGATLSWRGEPTAQTRFGGPGETVFWEVAPQRKPCSHGVMANAQCLQVRPVHYSAEGIKQPASADFSLFYGEIEGYQHQPGTRNILRLKRYPVANPPADGSSLAYVLDLVVESENVGP